MLESALRQVLAWTPEKVAAYCQPLTDRIASAASALGFSVPSLHAPHVVGLRRPADSSLPLIGDIKAELDRRCMAVSLRGGAIRGELSGWCRQPSGPREVLAFQPHPSRLHSLQ